MNFDFLFREDFIFFRTRDFALVSGISLAAATEKLKRFEKKGLLVKLTRGVWANHKHPYFSPIAAVPHLTSNRVCVSFLTALSRYGVISQIPQTIFVASSDRSKKLKTKIGNFEFIQLTPQMFTTGIIWSDDLKTTPGLRFQIASPEKALLDTLYISCRKNNRFSALPEIENTLINKKNFLKLLKSCVQDKRLSSAIKKKFESLMQS